MADDKVLDSTITDNGESAESIGYAIGHPPPRVRKTPSGIAAKVDRALSEAREYQQRRRYAEREARHIGEAQRKRYFNHILSVMPTQNGIQRMPSCVEFVKRVAEAYETISHRIGTHDTQQTYNDDWKAAVDEVRTILRRNQINVAHAYALQMRKAQTAGKTDLKAIWQEIAHCADRDDIDLKYQIWKAMLLPIDRCF